jgi:hypothetical protein
MAAAGTGDGRRKLHVAPSRLYPAGAAATAQVPPYYTIDRQRAGATLVLASVPLAVALAAMLRYGALLRPGPVTLVGSLPVAAITASARSLIHDLAATVTTPVRDLGVAALIAALGSMFGARMFRWWPRGSWQHPAG